MNNVTRSYGKEGTTMKKNEQNQVIANNKKIKKQYIKKQYMKPQLTSLGDIRDVTMGGSTGFGDSGGGAAEKPF